jgi:hypothetical protein
VNPSHNIETKNVACMLLWYLIQLIISGIKAGMEWSNGSLLY